MCDVRVAILRDLEQRWIEQIDDNVRRILYIGAILDPRFKTIKVTAPVFTESKLDMDSVFEFVSLNLLSGGYLRNRRLPVLS